MHRKRKVCHLTSVHPPLDTQIFYKECKTLAEAGYEVVLVAPASKDEVVDGVRIKAVPMPNGRLARMSRTVWQVYRAALREDARLYHFHDPELIPIGVLLRLAGKRVIYDVHEDVPLDISNKHWIPRKLRAPVAWSARIVERVAAGILSGIVAATPSIARNFPRRKTTLVQNFALPEELTHVDGGQPYRERPPLLAYVGVITPPRGIYELCQAMALIPEQVDAQLVLAGKFLSDELEAEVRLMPGWSRMEFAGWLPRAGVIDLLSKARVGLVTFLPAPNHMNSQPNKLFEYMSAGLPVIASDLPLWRELLASVGCGLLVDPMSPPAIAEAMQWLLEHPEEAEAMGKRGQEAVRTRYNWNIEARKLRKLYEKLTG